MPHNKDHFDVPYPQNQQYLYYHIDFFQSVWGRAMSVFTSLNQSEKLCGWNSLTNNVRVLLAVRGEEKTSHQLLSLQHTNQPAQVALCPVLLSSNCCLQPCNVNSVYYFQDVEYTSTSLERKWKNQSHHKCLGTCKGFISLGLGQ